MAAALLICVISAMVTIPLVERWFDSYRAEHGTYQNQNLPRPTSTKVAGIEYTLDAKGGKYTCSNESS